MTEEYKQMILKWLTNSLQEETGNNIPQFSQTNSIVNNLNNYIVEKLGSQPYYVKYIQMDGFDNYALFGNNGGDWYKLYCNIRYKYESNSIYWWIL